MAALFFDVSSLCKMPVSVGGHKRPAQGIETVDEVANQERENCCDTRGKDRVGSLFFFFLA